jgi:NADPH-dependent curcumin reductase CurA
VSRETRRYVLASRPTGRPTPDDFELETVELPAPAPGPGAVVVRTIYLSVDPYMRGRMRDRESYAESWDVGEPLRGGVVGEVVASNADGLAEGDLVTGSLPWADYALADADDLTPVDPDAAPISTALGVLGMPGRTAYFGVTEVLQPRPGDTVVVSGAAGAVGSVAGQLAAMAGASVVGFAGTDEKVRFVEEIGYDAGINYDETDDYRAAIDEATDGAGVDRYFDNVGGPITDAVFSRLNVDARVAVCGQIALYNAEEVPVGPRKLPTLIESRATVRGFLYRDFAPRFDEATRRLAEWVASGELTYRETITEGLTSAPEAFVGLFDGDNVGKQLVQVGEEPS